MTGSIGFEYPRRSLAFAVAMLVAACDKDGSPPDISKIGTERDIPGATAWLVEPSAFKSAGTRTVCALRRTGDTPGHPTGDDGSDDGIALSDEESRTLYSCAKSAMAANYRKAALASVAGYQSWTNYATTPYVSATHAQRYVNNYANDVAAAYGKYEALGELPVGSVVVKDSFSVAPDGRVTIGPLFVMEKVAHVAGASYPSPWRFTMIMPDGWVFGSTGGPGDGNVAFCADCHGAVADNHDSLYFLPPQYRR